jgi:RimJ/RimL family protein N-acetyltransferase
MVDLQLVKNEQKYHEFIRELRNNEKVQDGFIDSLPNITPIQQLEYMVQYGDCFYICLENEIPVGYIRHINNDIAVCVHPDHWNKGVATFMIKELMQKHPQCYAKIKLDNISSIKAFEKAGFKKKYYILEKE